MDRLYDRPKQGDQVINPGSGMGIQCNDETVVIGIIGIWLESNLGSCGWVGSRTIPSLTQMNMALSVLLQVE